MNDISVTCDENEARPAFYFDDSRLIRMKHVYLNNNKLKDDKSDVGYKNSDAIEF